MVNAIACARAQLRNMHKSSSDGSALLARCPKYSGPPEKLYQHVIKMYKDIIMLDLLEEVVSRIWKAVLNHKNESKKISEILLMSSGIGIGKMA